MPTHDYVIDNQTAPNFRADLNSALQAIVSTNSSTSAPATTYANMMWYDTTNNILYMRNEADDGWIPLGTLDQIANTFSANVAIATQVEAEAGTNNTKLMTPLRVAQSRPIMVTYQDVSGSRAINTVYSNPSATRPLVVAINFDKNFGGAVTQFESPFGTILTYWRDTASAASSGSVFAIVPPFVSYRFSVLAGSLSSIVWREALI